MRGTQDGSRKGGKRKGLAGVDREIEGKDSKWGFRGEGTGRSGEKSGKPEGKEKGGVRKKCRVRRKGKGRNREREV